MKKLIFMLVTAMLLSLSAIPVTADSIPEPGEVIEIEDEEVPLASVDAVLNGTESRVLLTTESLSEAIQNAEASGGAVMVKARTGSVHLTKVSVVFDATAAGVLRHTGKDVTIITDIVRFTLDGALIKTIAAVGSDVTLSAEKADPASYVTEGVDEEMAVYHLTLIDAEGDEVDFNGGSMSVTLPWDGKSTKVAYLDDKNAMVEIDDPVFQSGYVTFFTTHFTTWVLYFDTSSGSGSGLSAVLVGIGLCACVIVLSGIGKAMKRGKV